MTWVYTDPEQLTDRWGPMDFESYELTVTISCIEWFNVDNGATYCLVSDGLWETGGRFHLLFKAPRSNEAIDVTQLLGPVWQYYDSDTTAGKYRKVRGQLVNFLNRMLSATNVFDFEQPDD